MDGSPRELLERGLPALERAATEKRATELTEADLRAALATVAGEPAVEFTLRHWPQAGPIDLVVDHYVGFELQWCISGDGLSGCAWDIAKLATAIAEHKLSEGWVIAAAPSWHWLTRRPGVELFRPHIYVGVDLVEDYEDWWRLWCNEVTARPTHLPQSFALADPGSVSARIGRVPFEFRFVRVEVRGSTWVPHVCPHRWRDRLCLPRPWDPSGSGELAATRLRQPDRELSREADSQAV